jgi:hypothetical protein
MSLYTGKNRLIQSENLIENVKGQSTSSEVDPEYFGAKRRLSFKNENIKCDISISHIFLALECRKTNYVIDVMFN